MACIISKLDPIFLLIDKVGPTACTMFVECASSALALLTSTVMAYRNTIHQVCQRVGFSVVTELKESIYVSWHRTASHISVENNLLNGIKFQNTISSIDYISDWCLVIAYPIKNTYSISILLESNVMKIMISMHNWNKIEFEYRYFCINSFAYCNVNLH